MTQQQSVLESRRFYQRIIPLFLLSLISAILIVQYFAPAKTVLDQTKKDVLSLNEAVVLMNAIFGVVTLLLWRSRMVIRRTGNRMNIYSSFIFMGWYIFFVVLALSDPAKLTGSRTYSLVFQATIGAIGTAATGIKFLHHSFWTFRLFAAVSTLESATLFLAWLFTYLRELPLFVFIVPPLALTGDWIELFAFTAASRALLLSTAVGACIIAARALVGREPGLIDMEMVT